MPSPISSRRNLTKVHRERSAEETAIIKRLVWQWALQPEDKRASQKGLAQQLQVTRQYIAKVAKRVVLDAPVDLSERPIAIADLRGARDRRRFYTPAPYPTFETQDADEQTHYREPGICGTPVPQLPSPSSTQNQPGSPYQSNFSPYTAPRTYREWEQEGMLDGPRRNRSVRRVLFRVPI